MRILVVSPPRSGNHWIECLLSTIYELTNVGGSKKPGATSARAVRAWAQAGGFHDGWIMHMHRRFVPRSATLSRPCRPTSSRSSAIRTTSSCPTTTGRSSGRP